MGSLAVVQAVIRATLDMHPSHSRGSSVKESNDSSSTDSCPKDRGEQVLWTDNKPADSHRLEPEEDETAFTNQEIAIKAKVYVELDGSHLPLTSVYHIHRAMSIDFFLS